MDRQRRQTDGAGEGQSRDQEVGAHREGRRQSRGRGQVVRAERTAARGALEGQQLSGWLGGPQQSGSVARRGRAAGHGTQPSRQVVTRSDSGIPTRDAWASVLRPSPGHRATEPVPAEPPAHLTSVSPSAWDSDSLFHSLGGPGHRLPALCWACPD